MKFISLTNTYLGYIIIVKVVINIKITYSKQAIKFLKKLNKDNIRRILKAINNLPNGDVKKMKGSNNNSNRLRVGNFRIIYNIDGNIIYIEKIGNRGDIYNN